MKIERARKKKLDREKIRPKKMYTNHSIWLKPSLCMWLRFWCELNERGTQFHLEIEKNTRTHMGNPTNQLVSRTHTHTCWSTPEEKQMEWTKRRVSNTYWKKKTNDNKHTEPNRINSTLSVTLVCAVFRSQMREIKQKNTRERNNGHDSTTLQCNT